MKLEQPKWLYMAFKKVELQEAVQREGKKFEEYYVWLETHMPPKFFDELSAEDITLVVHNLMGLHLQDDFSQIHLKHRAIVLCLDTDDAALRILKPYRSYSIRHYRSFVSDTPYPHSDSKHFLHIGILSFFSLAEDPLSSAEQTELQALLQKNLPDMSDAEYKDLISGVYPRFIKSFTPERLVTAFHMYSRAKSRDECQYAVKMNQDWKEKKDLPSTQIVLAWRNIPKYNFLYRLAKIIYRHGLVLSKINACYINPYNSQNVLILSMGLNGKKGGAAWEECDIQDFLKELVTFKYFEGLEPIESAFVDTRLVSGNFGNLLKSMVHFVHSALVYADANLYSMANIEEGFCRHPELTLQLAKAFEAKFHPEKHNLTAYEKIKSAFFAFVDQLDTGNELNDTRRKNILREAMHFIDYCLKTNYYRNNKTGFSFRLDPHYLDHLPYERKDKFPEIPFGIFFVKGMHYTAFHIRFVDLARGGIRTVYPERMEQYLAERNNFFSECYNLAYTQNKKNKDIPEGGSKAVILLEPYEKMVPEEEIYRKDLLRSGLQAAAIDEKMQTYRKDQKLEYLYQAQRSFIENFVTLINCEATGVLKAKDIVDYWKKPEYIYTGPDENMHDKMIVWISEYSKHVKYKPGSAFITGKPGAGINHKEYGVTSLGVNTCMEEVLKYLGIDPYKDTFTIKMSGGPDGDVAGNEMNNLYRLYPKTAKFLATIDISGTINDPQGLDLAAVHTLFKEGKPIRFYPKEELSEGGFLLDTRTKKEESAYAQLTLCTRKREGVLVEEWLSGNEMNHILRHNVHETKADIFIPGGGRPRTLGDTNYKDFLDETGKPTARGIIEGANLYLTPWARRSLEKLGTLIIKDSSANKGGVICSSFEVLAGLILSDEEFLKVKETYIKEVQEIIKERARDETQLMLRTHKETGAFLTDLSESISEHINSYTYALLEHLTPLTLSSDPNDPLIRCLINYCPPTLRDHYQDRILSRLPDIHKKAIISCYLGSRLVYTRGLEWLPSIVDVLPLIVTDPKITG